MYRMGKVLTLLLLAALLVSACQPIVAQPQRALTTPEANKAFVLRYFEALNQDKSPATVDEYMTDEVLKHHIEIFETAFPGYQLRAEEMIDLVFVRTAFEGVHNGDLMGIAPTGKPVAIEIALIYRIENGKIVDHWMLADLLGVMQQIGVVPAQ